MNKLYTILFLLSIAGFTGCSKEDPIAVAGVELNLSTMNLEVGETKQLTATVMPENAANGSVTWMSDNPAVAAVSDAGLVTAVAVGEATVTAKAGEKRAVCSVTVKIPTITDKFDPLFAEELQKRGYIADARHIMPEDVKDIVELDVSGKGWDAELQEAIFGELTYLRGIEYFVSLQKLYCRYNRLTMLDVSKNTALTKVMV